MALRNLGIEHEVVAISEIDKYAIKSYEAIHGETYNVGDISKVDPNEIPDHDLFTYSFPCQDISVAGKQAGLDKDGGTRSGLLWECEKIIAAKKPKYLLLENVKNLVGKKHKPNFDVWLEWLETQGYSNYWKVLNAKDYGIPQNRERVFVVSILDDVKFEFEPPVELTTRLKDILESDVEEKYYLDDEKVSKLIYTNKGSELGFIPRTNGTQHQSNTVYSSENETCRTLTAGDYKDPVRIAIGASGGLEPKVLLNQDPKVINPLKGKTKNGWHFEQNVYSDNSLCRAVKAGGGSGNIPKILIKNATKKGYLEAEAGDGVDTGYPASNTRRGRVQKGVSQTLTTGDGLGVVVGTVYAHNSERFGCPLMKNVSKTLKANKHDTSVVFDNPLRIRKLTPLECWRLMGFNDEDFYKAEQVCSNTQLYKQAGNSIVVNVLESIFRQMFKGDSE